MRDGGDGAASDLTGALATDPPAQAPVDLYSVAAMDSPTQVPLGGLRRTLRALVAANAVTVQYLVDLTDFESDQGRRHHRPTPVELCGWLDALQRAADEISSNAIGLHHLCEVLWEHASLEARDRREAELEVERNGTT